MIILYKKQLEEHRGEGGKWAFWIFIIYPGSKLPNSRGKSSNGKAQPLPLHVDNVAGKMNLLYRTRQYCFPCKGLMKSGHLPHPLKNKKKRNKTRPGTEKKHLHHTGCYPHLRSPPKKNTQRRLLSYGRVVRAQNQSRCFMRETYISKNAHTHKGKNIK